MLYQKHSNTQPEQFGKTLVLFGGVSSEREVSLKSGQAVLAALLKSGVNAQGVDIGKNPVDQLHNLAADRAFICLHGEGGEDGKIQALLDFLSLPYTGSAHAASALAMDKLRTKQVWITRQLPTPRFDIAHAQTNWASMLDNLGGAVFVKPIHEGSSIGLSLAQTSQALKEAYQKAARLDKEVLVEQKITGAEYTVAILNGQVLPSVRVESHADFYDYNAKYVTGNTEYFCPSGLSNAQEAEIAKLALDAFNAIGCSSWGRVDIMQDKDGNFYLLELNTSPGMTNSSLVPMAAKEAGLPFDELVLEILAYTLSKKTC